MRQGVSLATKLIACTAILGASTIMAQDEMEANAEARFVQPLTLNAAQPLEFGTLAIPNSGGCVYSLSPNATRLSSGGLCQFIEGDTLPADFSLSCAADSLVQFQAIFSDEAPPGASFNAPDEPMAIDGAEPGAAYQMRACDGDGLSEVKVGGEIRLNSDAPHEFSGPVGSIRLEVAYN